MASRMNCRETRRVLWPADSLRVSDERVEAALCHAEGCEECGRFLERDRRIAALIHDSVPRARASGELRERLYTALARERSGEPRRSGAGSGMTWKMAAALLIAGLALAGAGHWLTEHRDAQSPASAFAEDYLRRVVEEDALRTSDRQRIGAFFARELGISARPPQFPGFEVKRAVICLMNGRRGGVVEYTRGPQRLSYYVLPYEYEAAQMPRQIDARRIEEGSELVTSSASQKGLGVATWRDGEHQHALVGNLPPEELADMAVSLASPTLRL